MNAVVSTKRVNVNVFFFNRFPLVAVLFRMVSDGVMMVCQSSSA